MYFTKKTSTGTTPLSTICAQTFTAKPSSKVQRIYITVPRCASTFKTKSSTAWAGHGTVCGSSMSKASQKNEVRSWDLSRILCHSWSGRTRSMFDTADMSSALSLFLQVVPFQAICVRMLSPPKPGIHHLQLNAWVASACLPINEQETWTVFQPSAYSPRVFTEQEFIFTKR